MNIAKPVEFQLPSDNSSIVTAKGRRVAAPAGIILVQPTDTELMEHMKEMVAAGNCWVLPPKQ
jgi:hypothetical protein